MTAFLQRRKQTICIGALATILKKHVPPFEIEQLTAGVPGFCNLSGLLDKRAPSSIIAYEDGMDYYDAAHFAQLIDAPFQIIRVALGDEICPPFGIIAMYNSIPASVPKKISFLQNSSHGYIPDTDVQRWYHY